MSALIRSTSAQIVPRANWGRWVVDCPRCPSALTLDPGTPAFRCVDCGTDAEVIWPPEETIYAVERLLLMRPDVTTQNWTPGETLHDLLRENALHGIFDGIEALGASPGTSYLMIDDAGIRNDILPVTRSRVLKAVAS